MVDELETIGEKLMKRWKEENKERRQSDKKRVRKRKVENVRGELQQTGQNDTKQRERKENLSKKHGKNLENMKIVDKWIEIWWKKMKCHIKQNN